MPKIYDNIAETLLSDLDTALGLSTHADFCVGYFNLRGWRHLDGRIANWPGGPGGQCRLLVGMHPSPREELHAAFHAHQGAGMDNALAIRLKRRLAEEFHEQLTLGVPTNEDEAGLKRLLVQLRAGQLVVKLFLRHPPLHGAEWRHGHHLLLRHRARGLRAGTRPMSRPKRGCCHADL